MDQALVGGLAGRAVAHANIWQPNVLAGLTNGHSVAGATLLIKRQVGTSAGKALVAARMQKPAGVGRLVATDPTVAFAAAEFSHDLSIASINGPDFLGLTAGAIFGPW